MEHILLWIPAIVSVIACIYTAGTLAQTVKNHGARLDKHSSTLDKHTEKLEGHALGLTELKAWHNGFTAGNTRG